MEPIIFSQALPGFNAGHDLNVARYEQALKQGYAVAANGTQIPLKGIEGLDIIGNMLEANSDLSPNLPFYGSIHNNLHGSISRALDPLQQFKLSLQMMGYITIVPKDPVFYSLHTLMDGLYEQYRSKLTPYSKPELTPLAGVTLRSVAVRSEGEAQDGRLHTYLQQTDLDVSLGMDFTPAGRQYARFTHLQHRAFDYALQIQNSESKAKKVFVRLFLLITQDEKGAPVDFDFQRRLSIQLDIFEAVLSPGANTVRRAATASALTLETDAVYTPQNNATAIRQRNACRCGWPQGMLLPRSSAAGTPYRLLAMVTDYETDGAPPSESEICRDAWLLCGAPGSNQYPDRRPMGFPFDRPYRRDVKSLADFLTPNMAVSDVVITFENQTEEPSALLPGSASTSWLPTSRRGRRQSTGTKPARRGPAKRG